MKRANVHEASSAPAGNVAISHACREDGTGTDRHDRTSSHRRDERPPCVHRHRERAGRGDLDGSTVIGELIDSIEALGLRLQIEHGLITPLSRARRKVDAGTGQACREIACLTCRVHHLRRERKIAAAGATKLRADARGCACRSAAASDSRDDDQLVPSARLNLPFLTAAGPSGWPGVSNAPLNVPLMLLPSNDSTVISSPSPVAQTFTDGCRLTFVSW